MIVSGVNLWDDGKIQVSFQHEDEPSRIITSVLGQLLDGEIHFNTPVFSEPGDYAVSIALDGYTYLPQKLSLFVHPSLSLGRPATSIINRRAQASHLYNLPVDIIGCADDDDMMRRMLSSEVFVRALFIEQLVVSNNDDELPIEAVILAKGVFNGPNMIQVTIDFSELCVKKTLFLQFAVSLNGRDFSAPQESDNVGFLLTHCTQILSLSPSCILEPLSGDGESERTIAFRLGADSLLDVTNFPSTVGLYCQFSAQGVVPRIRRPVSVSPDLLLTMRVPSIAEFFESAVGAMEQSSDIVVNDLPKTLTITMEIEAEIIDESIIPPPSALSSVDIVEFSDNSKATQEPCGASELKPDIVYEEGTRGSAFANDSGIQDIELAFDPSPSNIIQEISDHVSTDSISLQTCCKNETVLSDDPELQAKSDIQLNDVVERSENDDDEVPNATTSDVNWRTPLEIGAPTLTLCVPYLINVSPLMMRSSGSTQVIVSGLHGQMNGCLAVLLDGSTGALLCDPVPCVEMRDETLKDDDTDVKADESCTKGPFVAFNFNPQLSEPVERAHVCIVPDGINRWPVACSPVISIFDKIQLKTPSKAKAGALAQLIVSGIRFQDEIEPFSAMVRLSLLPPVLGDSNEIYKSNSSLSIDPTNDDLGNNVLPCSWIDVLGRLVMEQTVAAKGGKNSVANSAPAQLKVTFTLPSLSALSGLPTKTDSKTAPLMLYVGLSIDSAQSFDFSDKPILTIDVK